MGMQIRTNKSTSKTSNSVHNSIGLNLWNSTNILPNEMFYGNVDLHSVFSKERDESNRYRLIFTINPILTNVLFNTYTEIIKNEGSDNPILYDKRYPVTNGHNEDTDELVEAYGDQTPDRLKMIQNTEYSKKGLDYQYHCGYDIFNNHLLRSTSFKCVNMIKTKGDVDFNTINDYMRYNNGDNILFNRRSDIDIRPEMNLKKHLYDKEDILSIDDSINNNLIEENGWFGFTNGMKLNTRKIGNKGVNGDIFKETLDINKPMNNLNSCEFIDMYPDRSLFSFVPKINKKQKRIENNWDYCLTYPYAKTQNHILINGDGVNGLKCQYIIKSKGFNGGDVFLFRMSLPHNLNKGDKFNLYANGIRLGKPFTVANIGDLNNKNLQYEFYVVSDDIQDELGLTNDIYDDVYQLNKAMNIRSFRIRKLVGDVESEYYVRIFKRLPNLKYLKELPTPSNVRNLPTDFESELYQLSFATSIFNERSVQISFIDDINISEINDYYGRPISDIYLTIIKRNKGYKEWYSSIQPGVEGSGCYDFGDGSIGIRFTDYDPIVSNDGGTFKVKVLAKDNIGNSLSWYCDDGQSGFDGDFAFIKVDKCTSCVINGGCTNNYDAKYTFHTTEYNCVGKPFFSQVGISTGICDPNPKPTGNTCDDCISNYHTDANWHGLSYNKHGFNVAVYTSCYKDVPNPWSVDLIDRETGKKATWATATPNTGVGYCCPDWDCANLSDIVRKNKCIASTSQIINIVVDENKTTKQRTLDFLFKTTGGCSVSNNDYITQSGNENADDCPKKYAMFKNARTVTNFPQGGATLTEGLNLYCKPSDVTPTFVIDGVTGVNPTIDNGIVTFKIPENTSAESRTITITVNPNIDNAIQTLSSNDTYVNEGNIVYKNGEIFADYTDVDDNMGYNNTKNANIVISDYNMEIENKNDVISDEISRSTKASLANVEYSHCFGKITSGFKIHDHLSIPDGNGLQYATMDIMESDVTLLHNITSYKNKSSRALEDDITINGVLVNNLDTSFSNNGCFIGDIVEFNKVNANEVTLDSVYHRFNTLQRETVFDGDTTFAQFHWDEFMSDDWDPDGFKMIQTATTIEERSNLRPEGYYYKPHYKIMLRELSSQVYQDSVLKIIPTSVKLENDNMLLINTSTKHGFNDGDVVHITLLDSNKKDMKDYITTVFEVRNKASFILNANGVDISFGSLISGLMNGNIELRRFNGLIPDYAYPMGDGSGVYLWRTINNVGNIENTLLNEEDYPFTNGCFYHHERINFFLRRQDPYNTKGLYTIDKFPNDVIGTVKPSNKYDYINEEDIPC